MQCLRCFKKRKTSTDDLAVAIGQRYAEKWVENVEQINSPNPKTLTMSAELPHIVSRLENVTSRLESLAQKGVGNVTSSPEVAAEIVKAFDEILQGPFKQYLNLSGQIGGDIKSHSDLVSKVFNAQREFLVQVSKSKQPAQNVLMSMLQPTSSQIQAIQDFRERNRASTYFNHLSAISESIPALGWVTVAPTPAPYIKEMVDAGQFYTNRVLKDYKDKDKTHIDWTKAWIQTLTDLQVYVKKFHTTGLVWNATGTVANASVVAAPLPPGAPPPPPPPVGLIEDSSPQSSDARAALFQEINQGENITKGLRKVTADQQTHKNSSLRLGAQPFTPKPYKPFSQPPIAPKPTTTNISKPPKLELQGKKWVVEHYKDNPNIQVNDTSMNQAVYIFQCINCTIHVKGKVNSITLDNCKKTNILLDSIVSTLDFINCQRIQAQVTGKVPTVSIEKCDGAQVYLCKESLQAEIVSSKSSEMNILIPNDNGEYIELPVPELYKTVWNGKQLVTEPVEQKG